MNDDVKIDRQLVFRVKSVTTVTLPRTEREAKVSVTCVTRNSFKFSATKNNRSNEQQSAAAAGYGHKVLQQLSIPGDELTVGGGRRATHPEKRKQTGKPKKAKEAVAVATEEIDSNTTSNYQQPTF
jgi:hypothetical protein